MKIINRRNFLRLCRSTGVISLFPFGTPLFISNYARSNQDKSSVKVTVQNDLNWPQYVQEFPSLALDDHDNPWIAVLERNILNKNIKIFCYKEDTMYEVTKIQPQGITGLSDPHIYPFDNSMILAFSIEKNNRWDVAYSFIEKDNQVQKFNIIPHTGKVNVSPVITVFEDKAFILWESNNGGKRGIYTCQINKNGFTNPQKLSDHAVNSYNPTIVALPNGNMFAAWDSVRNNSADIYGAWFKEGKWQPEVRLTSDSRIEKHPYLANWENEVWMCWEAQSYREIYSNNLTEQRIVVAKLQDNNFDAPKHLFEYVSPDTHILSNLTDTPWITHYEHNPEKCYNLVRPRIAFDKNGSLWLSAKEFMEKRQDGSKPVIWNYHGDVWSDKKLLLDQQGKRQAVEIAFGTNKGFAVYQYDDLPLSESSEYKGIICTWKSGFGISKLPVNTIKGELITEQLKMPFSNFSLKRNIAIINADFPRQKVNFHGNNLNLYFGDLHNHTDISICRRSWNPTAKDDFDICRDIEKLDFCALTDHGYNFDTAQWDFLGEQVRSNHDDDSFVTFLAEEWTSNNNPPNAPKELQGYGHHNLIFANPYYSHFYDSYDGDINPEMLWEQLQKDGADFICIPHQLADMGTNIPIDWRYVNEKFQPVAEIFQGRGSYEYLGCPRQAPHGAKFKGRYIHDVWEQGNIIGIIASPDHWGGIGKAAVWAKDLSRESIFEGIRARHTYGTSGAKIGLLFRTKQALMGDKVLMSSNSNYKFHIKALASANINEVVIFRNNEIIYKVVPNEKEITVEWEDIKPLKAGSAWYYTRIQCDDNELAWSSPIWFVEKL